jgi:hypothetical protein
LPAILIYRFILNLRDEASASHTQTTARISTVRFGFNSDIIVGNMGQSLQFGSEDRGENDEDENVSQAAEVYSAA